VRRVQRSLRQSSQSLLLHRRSLPVLLLLRPLPLVALFRLLNTRRNIRSQKPYRKAMCRTIATHSRRIESHIFCSELFSEFSACNFYAGYTGRAVAQLLISVLTLFFGSFISAIWAIIEVCTVTADASGVPFK
jgi:hypothetical protein